MDKKTVPERYEDFAKLTPWFQSTPPRVGATGKPCGVEVEV